MLSYRQKRFIIEYLADPAHWQGCTLDPDWVDMPDRHFRNTSDNRIVKTHISDRHIKLRDNETNALLELVVDGDKIRARDETSQEVVFHRSGKYAVDPERPGVSLHPYNKHIFQILPGRHMDWDEGNLTALFLEQGAKKIRFDASGNVAYFSPTPDPLRVRKEHMQAVYNQHSAAFPSDLSNGPDLNEVKLVIAFDLALEPGLKAINSYAIFDDLQVRPKHWSDTCEFSGHDIAIPSNYRIETTWREFNISMDSDRRDWIITNAQLAKRAFDMAPSSWKESSDLHSENILAGIEKGARVAAFNGTAWRMGVYEANHAHLIANNARYFFGGIFNMSGRDYLAINHDENMFILGVNEEKLRIARHALSATQEVDGKIIAELPGIAKQLKFLRTPPDKRGGISPQLNF
ncbi:MAG: hypothetical protein DYH13_11280 [Alphaproteobacteria bacterium PRO2]|nr:hypothetical protein [Alphaproteobacteria bacterium PRO2]